MALPWVCQGFLHEAFTVSPFSKQYLGSMLIKDLRGTESTQDACAKMRVRRPRGWGGFAHSLWWMMWRKERGDLSEAVVSQTLQGAVVQSRGPGYLTGCATVTGELPLPSTFPHTWKVCAVGEWAFCLGKGCWACFRSPSLPLCFHQEQAFLLLVQDPQSLPLQGSGLEVSGVGWGGGEEGSIYSQLVT